MIMHDPKKTASVILAKMNPSAAPRAMAEGGDVGDALPDLLREFKEALDAGDFEGAAQAFRSAAMSCDDVSEE